MVVVISQVYIIMHQYFGKKNRNEKNECINFYKLHMFSCMIISCSCDQYSGPQNFNLMNTKKWIQKNEPNGQKK